jgi:hypothetical protein
MQGKTTITKDGKVINEVLDREGQDCRLIQTLGVTGGVGRVISDEQTGPDSDTVHEVSRD